MWSKVAAVTEVKVHLVNARNIEDCEDVQTNICFILTCISRVMAQLNSMSKRSKSAALKAPFVIKPFL
jgi:hypothetical protein